MPGACWRAGRALAPRGSEMQGWVTCKSTEAPFVLARPPQGSEVSCPQEAQPRASAHSSHLVSVTSQPGPAGTSHGRGTSPNPRAATTRGPGASDKNAQWKAPRWSRPHLTSATRDADVGDDTPSSREHGPIKSSCPVPAPGRPLYLRDDRIQAVGPPGVVHWV